MGKTDLIEFDLSKFNIKQVANRKYFVDKDGNIFKKNTNTDTTKPVKGSINNGCRVLWVSKAESGNRTCIYFRQIIATVFHNYNVSNKEQHIINKDYDKLNCSPDNISVVTKKEWLDHYKPYFTKMKGIDRSSNPGFTKLKPKQVIKIKKAIAKKVSFKKIATDYNISLGQVYRINRGDNWKNITI